MIIKIIKNSSINNISLKNLCCKLNNKDKNKLKQIKKDYKKSFLIGRYLLDQAGIDISKIYYSKNGKPLIENKYFSISHGDDVTILVIANYEVGVDIEKNRELNTITKNFFIETFHCDKNSSSYHILEEFVKRESYIKLNRLALKNLGDNINNYQFKVFNIDDYIVSICYK